MQTYLDCIPCLLRQAIEAPRMVSASEAVQETVVRKVLSELSSGDFNQPPTVMAQSIHRHIRILTGEKDPYKKIKERFNSLAISMLPELEEKIAQAQHPMETSVRLAIAGNVIDMGINGNLEDAQVKEAIQHALISPLRGELEQFIQAVAQAKHILYLADNAGEIVFDRLLLQQLPLERVTLAVRGMPVINDATCEDARTADIDSLVKVIDNGSDAPGTILSECSEVFLQHFNQADLIIAKGQGNYESLNCVSKDIFFVLKAKCPVIARDLGCTVGDLILQRSTHKAETTLCSRDAGTIGTHGLMRGAGSQLV